MKTSPGALLVVDDNEMNRDMLSRRLRRQGYEVVTAVDGPQCTGADRGAGFELVLLDIEMPGMSGLEVLRILRQRLSAIRAADHHGDGTPADARTSSRA